MWLLLPPHPCAKRQLRDGGKSKMQFACEACYKAKDYLNSRGCWAADYTIVSLNAYESDSILQWYELIIMGNTTHTMKTAQK